MNPRGSPLAHQVTFFPHNKTVWVETGKRLLDAALDNGIDLEHNCGGNCACATCHIIVREGMENLSVKEMEEDDQLDMADGLTENSRLACQARVYGQVVVEVAES